MNADERLLYETRVRMRQAVLAGIAGVLLVVGAALQLVGPHAKVEELTVDLIVAHKRVPLDQIAAVVNALGLLSLAATLAYLFDSVRARNPELRAFIRPLAISGGIGAAVIGIAYSITIAVKAQQFITHGSQTYVEANHLTKSGVLAVLPFIGQLAALLLAVGFVLVSLNAMRVGLLTRFMGYLGIFVGVLVLFPIGSPVPVVEGFWLVALGYLFSGRWPSGVPPAWRSGRAEPWPSSQQVREQRIRAAGGRGRATPAPAPAAQAVGTPAPARTRSATPKRKRKRRR